MAKWEHSVIVDFESDGPPENEKLLSMFCQKCFDRLNSEIARINQERETEKIRRVARTLHSWGYRFG